MSRYEFRAVIRSKDEAARPRRRPPWATTATRMAWAGKRPLGLRALAATSIVGLVVTACAAGPPGSLAPAPAGSGELASPAASAQSPRPLHSSVETVAPAPTDAPPSAAPPKAPSPRAGPSRLVERADRSSQEVALTFTVGYRIGQGVAIVELLSQRNVPATVFMSGVVFDQGETRRDSEEVLRMILARPDLFQLGQHGYAARELARLPRDEVLAEVQGAERTLGRYGITELGPYFSPPGGAWSPELLDTLGSLGYATTVLWDVDPLDWLPSAEGGPSADDVAARVLGKVEGGSIVLLHLGGWNTLSALPTIIDGLEARGLRPVTIAHLLTGR